MSLQRVVKVMTLWSFEKTLGETQRAPRCHSQRLKVVFREIVPRSSLRKNTVVRSLITGDPKAATLLAPSQDTSMSCVARFSQVQRWPPGLSPAEEELTQEAYLRPPSQCRVPTHVGDASRDKEGCPRQTRGVR